MANEKLFNVGVKALIVNNENKILVAQASTHAFTNPGPAHGDLIGGRIEQGQTAEATLTREIAEEIGVTEVSDIRFAYAVISPSVQIKISDDVTVGLALHVYRVKIPEGAELRMSEEHTSFAWLDPTLAAEQLEYKFGSEFSAWLRADGASGR